MKDKIKLCLFDMDGTLIDTESYVWLKGKQAIIEEFGYEYDDYYWRSITGIGFQRFTAEISKHFGKEFDANLFLEKLYAYYEDVVHKDGVPLKKGGKELLAYLKKNNIKIALGTSTGRQYVELIMNKLGIIDVFDSIVCGDEVEQDKPNPEIYLRSSRNLNIATKNCLIIEDSITGLKTAKNADMRCAIVKDIYPYKQHDLDDADYVFDDMNEIIPILERINNDD